MALLGKRLCISTDEYVLHTCLGGLHTCLTPAKSEQKAAGSGPAAPGALAEAGAAPVCGDGGSLEGPCWIIPLHVSFALCQTCNWEMHTKFGCDLQQEFPSAQSAPRKVRAKPVA